MTHPGQADDVCTQLERYLCQGVKGDIVTPFCLFQKMYQMYGWFLTKKCWHWSPSARVILDKKCRIVQNNDLQLQIGHPVNDDKHLFYKVQCHKSKIILSTNMGITLS